LEPQAPHQDRAVQIEDALAFDNRLRADRVVARGKRRHLHVGTETLERCGNPARALVNVDDDPGRAAHSRCIGGFPYRNSTGDSASRLAWGRQGLAEAATNLERCLQLRQRREEVIAIAARFGAGDVRVIGSVARGTAAPTSDVDFLVTLRPERSLLDLGGLQVALEDLLGCPVHVVTDGHAPSATPTGTPSDDREERLLARLRADAVPV